MEACSEVAATPAVMKRDRRSFALGRQPPPSLQLAARMPQVSGKSSREADTRGSGSSDGPAVKPCVKLGLSKKSTSTGFSLNSFRLVKGTTSASEIDTPELRKESPRDVFSFELGQLPCSAEAEETKSISVLQPGAFSLNSSARLQAAAAAAQKSIASRELKEDKICYAQDATMDVHHSNSNITNASVKTLQPPPQPTTPLAETLYTPSESADLLPPGVAASATPSASPAPQTTLPPLKLPVSTSPAAQTQARVALSQPPWQGMQQRGCPSSLFVPWGKSNTQTE
eukprot:2362337-Pleurochrysis_carterae.AAC.2